MTVASVRKRHLPYLQRNWTTVWHPMGTNISSSEKDTGNGKRLHDGTLINQGPLSKRPRVKAPSPTLDDIPALDDLILPRVSTSRSRSLRIEVLKIVHKDTARRVKPNVTLDSFDRPSKPLVDVTTVEARCKITILDYSPQWSHAPPVVYCTSQPCHIKTFKDPIGTSLMARVYLSSPFVIPEELIAVPKRDGSFGIADSYRLDIELYAAEDQPWPPLDLMTGPQAATDGPWVLLGCILDLFKKSRTNMDLYVHPYTRESMRRTNFMLDVDARWSTGLGHPHTPPPEKGVMPSIVVLEKGFKGDVVVNGHSSTSTPPTPTRQPFWAVRGNLGDEDADTPGLAAAPDPLEELEGETTPNRSLRTRSSRVYNLKVLSDQAQGIARKRTQRTTSTLSYDGAVVYSLPTDDVSVDSYRCLCCGLAHQNVDQLISHLGLVHPAYVFEPRPDKDVQRFRVKHRFEWYTLPGDGSDTKKPIGLASSGSPSGMDGTSMQRRSKTESGSPVGLSSAVNGYSTRPTTRPTRRSLPKVLVPNIKQPLFDAVSKERLEPGSEILTHKRDESWWIRKHRDIISDFSDINPAEREFVLEWDAFVLPRRIVSEKFLPRVWVSFVREKIDWILSSEAREAEFLKHMAYLQLRATIDPQSLQEVCEILAAARGRRTERPDGKQAVPEALSSPPKAYSQAPPCSACGVAIAGPVCQLICSETSCARVFHLFCVEDSAADDVRALNWRCNECASGGAAASKTPNE